MRPAFRILCLAIAIVPTVHAQSWSLESRGGALGAPLSFTIDGDANRPYFLLFDLTEQTTPLPGGLASLDIGLRFLGIASGLPGFVGTLDAQGQRSIATSLPNDPRLDGRRLSFQALATDALDTVSDLVRVVGQPVETSRPTLDSLDLSIAANGATTTLADGRELILSALSPVVQIFDPKLEEWTSFPLLCPVPLLASVTPLPDGRILVAGGLGLDGQPIDQATVIDPSVPSCTGFQMSIARAGHAAAMTGNGEVLLTGGFEVIDTSGILQLFGGLRASSELFDPSTGTFRSGTSMLEPKALHTATTNGSGDVVVAGGLTLLPIINIPFVSNTAYLWDTSSDAFAILPQLFTTGRMLHSATRLDNGRVLLVGGVTIDFTAFLDSGDPADLALTSLADGEEWRSSFFGGSFTHVSGLQVPRALPAVIALPGGEALVAGGLELTLKGNLSEITFNARDEADLYAGQSFRATGSLTAPRLAPFGAALSNDGILILGGGGNTAEIYRR
ncbi:MAG: hypothetical protein RL885_16925 [Planctomycetota bacterium]